MIITRTHTFTRTHTHTHTHTLSLSSSQIFDNSDHDLVLSLLFHPQYAALLYRLLLPRNSPPLLPPTATTFLPPPPPPPITPQALLFLYLHHGQRHRSHLVASRCSPLLKTHTVQSHQRSSRRHPALRICRQTRYPCQGLRTVGAWTINESLMWWCTRHWVRRWG